MHINIGVRSGSEIKLATRDLGLFLFICPSLIINGTLFTSYTHHSSAKKLSFVACKLRVFMVRATLTIINWFIVYSNLYSPAVIRENDWFILQELILQILYIWKEYKHSFAKGMSIQNVVNKSAKKWIRQILDLIKSNIKSIFNFYREIFSSKSRRPPLLLAKRLSHWYLYPCLLSPLLAKCIFTNY